MNCPSCGDVETFVVDSRPRPEGIRRRRQCSKCSDRFSTMETIGDARSTWSARSAEAARALELIADVAAKHSATSPDVALDLFLGSSMRIAAAAKDPPTESIGRLADSAAFALLVLEALLKGEPVVGGGEFRNFDDMPRVVSSGGLPPASGGHAP